MAYSDIKLSPRPASLNNVIDHFETRDLRNRLKPSPLIVIPKNGLGNRFRAISAALGISRVLGRELRVNWEPYDGLPASASDLFAEPLPISFSSIDEMSAQPFDSSNIPNYLNSTPEIISLRGHNLGEQRFIRRFVTQARNNPRALAIIVAGNYFSFPKTPLVNLDRLTRSLRQEFLLNLHFKPEIEEVALKTRPSRAYIGLHLRGGDRRKEVPSPERLLKATKSLIGRSKVRDVYLSSDQIELRDLAIGELSAAGVSVHLDERVPDRRTIDGVRHACADFINLRHADFIVGARPSTFATEASVLLQDSRRLLLAKRRFLN